MDEAAQCVWSPSQEATKSAELQRLSTALLQTPFTFPDKFLSKYRALLFGAHSAPYAQDRLNLFLVWSGRGEIIGTILLVGSWPASEIKMLQPLHEVQTVLSRFNKRNYHVGAGNWIRESRGIYRLALFPRPERPDLVIWWLRSRNRSDDPQGVYSHQTALSLHELTDLMPAKIEMTVPKTFCRGTPIPRVLRLHYADLKRDEIENIHGIPVTTPLRSILDLWQSEEAPRDVLRDALKEATRLGKITRRQIQAASKNPHWQQAIKQITEGNAAWRKAASTKQLQHFERHSKTGSPKNLVHLRGHPFKILVFVGANQTKVPLELAAALQPFGKDAEYITISGNGRNALDFHIAFSIGELSKEDPDSYAWLASFLYLRIQQGQRILSSEHRSAPGFGPVALELAQSDMGASLKISSFTANTFDSSPNDLTSRITELMASAPEPLTVNSIRTRLQVRNERVVEAIRSLASQGKIKRLARGFSLS
jgi:predicted transcriptional regulator of viral defense system